MMRAAEPMHKCMGFDVPLERDRIAELMEHCRITQMDGGFVASAEVPLIFGTVPAVNHIVAWDGSPMGELLAAHEGGSGLPSTLSVLAGHPRQAALMRALKARGYTVQETTMVKR